VALSRPARRGCATVAGPVQGFTPLQRRPWRDMRAEASLPGDAKQRRHPPPPAPAPSPPRLPSLLSPGELSTEKDRGTKLDGGPWAATEASAVHLPADSRSLGPLGRIPRTHPRPEPRSPGPLRPGAAWRHCRRASPVHAAPAPAPGQVPPRPFPPPALEDRPALRGAAAQKAAVRGTSVEGAVQGSGGQRGTGGSGSRLLF